MQSASAMAICATGWAGATVLPRANDEAIVRELRLWAAAVAAPAAAEGF